MQVELNTKTDKDSAALLSSPGNNTQKNKCSINIRTLAVIVLIVFIILITIVIVIELESSPTTKPDILYIYHEQNRIYTMDHINQDIETNTSVQAICIDTTNKQFISVGNASHVLSQCVSTDHRSIKQLYFNGSMAHNVTILPGLTDSHAHIMSYGANFFRAELSTAASVAEVFDAIHDFIQNYPNAISDGWVEGFGWDQELWTDQSGFIDGLPTRYLLDDQFPTYKLFLRRIDGHSAWINTAALNAIPGVLPDDNPEGGEIIRDSNGTATGALVDTAMNYVWGQIPSRTQSEQFEMLRLVLNECTENGLTGVHDAGNDPSNIELFKAVIDDPDEHGFRFTIRVNAMASHRYEPHDYSHLKNVLYKDLLTVNTVKFMMDGALGSRGAALIEPYCDLNTTNGLLFYDTDTFYNDISKWHDAGYQIATHAIGDAANREVIDAYINLTIKYELGDDHRLRIEHAQIVNATYDIPRMGQYNIIPSMQPTHATADMVFAEDRLCEYRLTGAYAWQRMLNYSVPALPFGSDFPAVGVVNPFLGIFAAITRENEIGSPTGGWTPYNKVSRYEAIKGYTYDAAYAAFQEDRLGTISAGKLADFIIIDRDPFEVDDMDISDTNVIATFLGGDPVYVDPQWKDILML
eukprot:52412_1